MADKKIVDLAGLTEFLAKIKAWCHNTFCAKTDVPSVGDGTITITQAGVTKGTFTTNQSGSKTIALTDNNTTYSAATTSTAGLMSAADKTKLNGIATGATATTAPNDATITITQGGTAKGSFTLNQSSDATIALDAGGSGSSWSIDATTTANPGSSTTSQWDFRGFCWRTEKVNAFYHIELLQIISNTSSVSLTDWECAATWDAKTLFGGLDKLTSSEFVQSLGNVSAYAMVLTDASGGDLQELDVELEFSPDTYEWVEFIKGDLDPTSHMYTLVHFDFWVAKD